MTFCLGFYVGNGAPLTATDPIILMIQNLLVECDGANQTLRDDFFIIDTGSSTDLYAVTDGHLILKRTTSNAPPVFYEKTPHGVFFSTCQDMLIKIRRWRGDLIHVHSFARNALLQRGYVSSGPYTLIGGILRILTGETVTISPHLNLTYRAVLPPPDNQDLPLENRTLLLDGTIPSLNAAIHQKSIHPDAPPPVWVFYDDPLGDSSVFYKKLMDQGICPRRLALNEKQFWSFLPGALSQCFNPVFSPLWPLYLFAFQTYPDTKWIIPHCYFPLTQAPRSFLGIPMRTGGLWTHLPRGLSHLLTPWDIDNGALCAHYGSTPSAGNPILNAIQTDESIVYSMAGLGVEWVLGYPESCPSYGSEKPDPSCFYPLSWAYNKRLRLSPLLSRAPGIDDIMTRSDVARLQSNGGEMCRWASYRLILYALWYQHHIDGLDLPSDTPSALMKRGPRTKSER